MVNFTTFYPSESALEMVEYRRRLCAREHLLFANELDKIIHLDFMKAMVRLEGFCTGGQSA